MPSQENDAKCVHVLQVAWELEETFNGSLTHSQYILNKFFIYIFFIYIAHFPVFLFKNYFNFFVFGL